MVQRYYNPFSEITLLYPPDQRDFYQQYCRPSRLSRVDDSPFPRMVDLWFAGLLVAARNAFERNEIKSIGLTSKRLSGDGDSAKHLSRGVERGTTFEGEDSWRVQIVMLVAIAVEGDVEVVADPNRMMAIANRLAAAGVPHIVRMLEDGSDAPIWNLSDALEQLLTEE